MFFKVFDSEHRGYIEGKAIKRSLQFLDDVPINEINEILTKTKLTDDRKITIEGNCPPSLIITSFYALASPLPTNPNRERKKTTTKKQLFKFDLRLISSSKIMKVLKAPLFNSLTIN